MMDILKAEIARKRKQIEKSEVVACDKKFFRRGDLAAKQQEEYWAKQYEKHGLKKGDEAKSSQEVSHLFYSPVTSESKLELPRNEVIRRLRERHEPILLFGESEEEALKRLRKLEIEAPEMKEGYRNDFQAALHQVDEEYLNEVIQGSQDSSGRHDVKVDEKLSSFEEIVKMAEELGSGDAARDCEIIFGFYNFILQKWGHQLNSRPEKIKRSGRGKLDSATHTQTVEHVRPLFTQLKNKNCASDIREHLVHVTRFLLERDYIQANNAYMEMAVGNAPWPVGVTRSGIHQRPGSEKSYVKNIAHVLNDETQRKYIQGIKRLMTRCQMFFPTDPSKSVDFNAINNPSTIAEET